MTTNSTKNSLLSVPLLGAMSGIVAGIALCVLTGLSPFSSVDREALILLALTISLPLGALTVTRSQNRLPTLDHGQRAVMAGLLLAFVVTIGDPMMGLSTVAWIVPATLIGGAISGTINARWLGVVISAIWLLLCAMPFLYETSIYAEWIALRGCPWLGMSLDVVGGDPLRREVIYMGEMSPVVDSPVQSLMGRGTLWIGALLATCTLLIRTKFTHERT